MDRIGTALEGRERLRTECVERRAPQRGATWLALLALIFLVACTGKNDFLIGHWTAEKVNVDFDENIATPEMVRMFGEIDKQNTIEIAKDSLLTFISDGDTLRGQASLVEQELFLDGKPFATFHDGKLVTENVTPLGKVTVRYSKTKN